MQYRSLPVIALLLCSACVDTAPDVDPALLAPSDPIKACPIPDRADIDGDESIFYLCAEEHADHGHGCGPDGYLLGYGTKYSGRFYRHTRPKMSARGQVWIDDVLVCLQRDLRASIDVTSSCDQIHTIAYDSHPRCYLDAGVCELLPFDLLLVLWSIDLRDYLSVDFARQLARVAAGCGDYYADMLGWLFPRLVP
jgi:hypothetical protein